MARDYQTLDKEITEWQMGRANGGQCEGQQRKNQHTQQDTAYSYSSSADSFHELRVL